MLMLFVPSDARQIVGTAPAELAEQLSKMKGLALQRRFAMEDADGKRYWHGEGELGNKWLPTEDGRKFLTLVELRRMY